MNKKALKITTIIFLIIMIASLVAGIILPVL